MSLNHTDIDECQLDSDGCNQTCTNSDGSFQCSCVNGYTLLADNLGCDGNYQVNNALEFINFIVMWVEIIDFSIKFASTSEDQIFYKTECCL